MPTGYTAGIVDGKITTFEQFAKQCIRAFGATIHMRDDNLDVEYTPRTPDDYHKESLRDAKRLYQQAIELSDEDILKNRKKEIEEEIKHAEDRIEQIRKSKEVLLEMKSKAEVWIPPTKDHEEFKKFMIQQLDSTIEYDGDNTYVKVELYQKREELKNLDVDVEREKMKEAAQEDIVYHTKKYYEEIGRCAKSNKWVEDLLQTLTND